MRIEEIDLSYLSMPTIEDVGDGSQDALLVRVRGGGYEGWGECEASPLTSIASFVCPPSHSACKPVRDSVLGQRLDSVHDIERIGRAVRANSLDLLQADHTLSGIDIALWDLLGKRLDAPVYELLGYTKAFPKRPYASRLFGADPAQTLSFAREIREQGFTAAKFGWEPYGRGSAEVDADHVAAAREGLGPDATLLIDAGTVWEADVEEATKRIPALQEHNVLFLEEPFVSGALDSYHALSEVSAPVRLAGGEGSHNFYMAYHMLQHAGLGYIQVDAGRIGGITTAKQVADAAAAQGVTYINHTFTSNLALSASLQPYAGVELAELCEFPVATRELAARLTVETITPDENGMINLPEGPGLGVQVDLATVKAYHRDVEIRVNSETLFRSEPPT